MIKACIFDLDGTLADTLESMAYVTNEILKQYGLRTLPVENFKYYSGEGASVLVKKALRDAGDKDLTLFEECDRLYRKMFAEDPMYKVTCYEGMPQTLKEMKKRGMKLAVCSNKPHPAAVKVINQLYGEDFDIILGQREDIPRKPAPDGALMIAREFSVQPAECMYVGDTGTDMQTGKAAGMFTVGALWGFRESKELNENGADVLAQVPLDLLKLCEG
ncbi:MAG: HAD family hydrolase [Clostridia bacterium]|nr:HAD family hydrolase [Clostridia bacterium]MDY5555880.1 HAD family hydrolase [Blautia sp.]